MLDRRPATNSVRRSFASTTARGVARCRPRCATGATGRSESADDGERLDEVRRWKMRPTLISAETKDRACHSRRGGNRRQAPAIDTVATTASGARVGSVSELRRSVTSARYHRQTSPTGRERRSPHRLRASASSSSPGQRACLMLHALARTGARQPLAAARLNHRDAKMHDRMPRSRLASLLARARATHVAKTPPGLGLEVATHAAGV
jgi:hypothetical protein